jgi:NTP pyrophosphatase (non-canonical NTP hydrolase)
MKSFNKLSLAQIERLAILAEECGETVQAAMKVIRRGYDRKHPRKPGPTNRGHLEEELGNVLNAIEMLIKAGDVRQKKIQASLESKRERVKKYLYHN